MLPQVVVLASANICRNRDLAAEAYHTAIAHLKNEIGVGSNSPVPIENLASIQDIYRIVETAKQRYVLASSKHTGARQWLEKLSQRVMYYKPIMDTLAQHHPEYVALGWGAVKFVMMVSQLGRGDGEISSKIIS